MSDYKPHYSVLKNECVEYLTSVNLTKNLILADFTFGAGGHSVELAQNIRVGKVYAFDQDSEAIKNGRELIIKLNLEDKINLFHTNFEFFDSFLSEEIKLDGVLIDLGVSSHHFDSGERGFSFRQDALLDMRMDITDEQKPTVANLLETLSVNELERIFRDYGEEKYSKRIAQKIVSMRDNGNSVKTTLELEDLIFHCYPKAERYGGKSPSTRVFQALRIAVNDELGVLERVIEKVVSRLSIKGRLAIISFHSLEDRIVKNAFKSFESNVELACQVLTKKPIVPTSSEILENSRSRSAKLRVIERVEAIRSKNKYAHRPVKE